MIKRIFFLFALKFFLVGAFAATATIPYVDVTFTAAPADGDTVTINGSVRTFKTSVSSPSSQVLIGATASDTAQNYFTQIRTTPYASCNSSGPHGTTVKVWGNLSASMTASKTGAWGSVTVQSQNADAFTFQVSLLAIDSALRAPRANTLLTNLQDMATITLAANSAFMANFANLSTAQTINGAKTFPGANVYSNASQMFTLGNVSNVTARAIKLKQAATLSGLYMLNSSDSAVYTVAPDSAGRPTIKSLSGDTLGTGPTYTPNADDILTRSIAATYFGALASNNEWTGTNTFASIQQSLLDGSTVRATNIIAHASILLADWFHARGTVELSNAAPALIYWDTNASSGLRGYRWLMDDGTLRLQLGDDSADYTGTAKEVMSFVRTGDLNTQVTATFRSPVSILGGLSLTGADYLEADPGFMTPGYYVIGDGTGIPDGFIGGIFFGDGGGTPIADPTDGIALWSDSGEFKYRSSASNEGSGTSNHIHNRGAVTQGAGTDYTLTSSTAAVDFGTTDPNFTAPTDGTFLIWAEESVTAGGTGGDDYRAKLRNTSTSTDLGGDQSITHLAASEVGTLKMFTIATLSAANVVAIYSHNNTAARGTVNSARTRIGYVRLY